MEKDDDRVQTYVSQTIQGRLYRKVDSDQYYQNCIKKEHDFSIKLKYNLNKTIIRQADQKFHKFLKQCYIEIVKPMTNELKELMYSFTIINEAELYCSNLSFKMNDQAGKKYIGDAARKEEDVVQTLTANIEKIRDKYTQRMKRINKYD